VVKFSEETSLEADRSAAAGVLVKGAGSDIARACGGLVLLADLDQRPVDHETERGTAR
jgi:hypothetical protein